MNETRRQQLTVLLVDTKALIERIHAELGSWEYVEGFLVGAVDNHRSREQEFVLYADDPEADGLVAELAGRRHCND